MIKDTRMKAKINNTLDKEIDSVRKKYELQKNSFITKFTHRTMKRNSLVDINSRSLNHNILGDIPDFEGIPF